ncbi:MAG TPA: DUF1702 family protein [Herpetosiphonaceae bacterium]
MSQPRGAVPGALRLLYHHLASRAADLAQTAPSESEMLARQQLERIKRSFVYGYQAALLGFNDEKLARKLNEVDRDLRGFAFEGAAATLTALDLLMVWRPNRLPRFLNGVGAEHIYAGYIGVGWILARLPAHTERRVAWLDPLLRWLAIDGYGFHEGYFHPYRTVTQQLVPDQLAGYACRAFDQGLGRSLWFLAGANVLHIPGMIGKFDPLRRADLWSGVGLACTYAGGVDQAAIRVLLERAGPYQADMALGSALAAKARQRAGCSTDYTDLACTILYGLSARNAARITDDALADLPFDAPEPAYEIWRQRIQQSVTAARFSDAVDSD